MPLTPGQVSDEFGDLLVGLINGTITQAEFETQYAALWSEATTGGTSIALIGAQMSALLGLWNLNQVQMNDWMMGTDDYESPDPDQPEAGWYPLTSYLGTRIWVPSPQRMVSDFAGIQIEGTLNDPAELQTGDRPGKPIGTVYIIDGHYWVKNAGGYADAGSFVGPQGDPGPVGPKGWSPVFSVVADVDRRVLRVVDWVGGEGAKPATGSYVGGDGFVSDIAQAVNVRGTQGIQGIQGPKGDKGDAYEPDVVAPFAERVNYNNEVEGFSFLASDEGNIYFRVGAAGNWTEAIPFGRGDQGDQGYKGWAPVPAVVVDGARRVIQIADWVGGEGDKPDVGDFVGPNGLVPDAASAVDIRGGQGIQGVTGDRGWSPVFSSEYDGIRAVLKVVDWQGGQGAKPAINKYVGAAGLVDAINEAVNIRGLQGAAFTINAVGLFSERATYNGEPQGFVFLARDQSMLYVRAANPGTWSDGTPLVSGTLTRFSVKGALTPGVQQTITIPVGISTIDEVQVFINGVKIAAPEFGLTRHSATEVRFTAPADISGNYEITIPGGVKGEDGQSFEPDARAPFAQRVNYNNEAIGFVFFATDQANFYIRNGAAGNWAGPFSLSQGAQGPPGQDAVLSDAVPQPLGAAASAGDDAAAARGDHVHQYPLATRKVVNGNYTLIAADHGLIIETGDATAQTITLPNSLFAGFNCSIYRAGAGEVTVAAEAGATLQNPDGHTKLRNTYSEASVRIRVNAGGTAAIWAFNGDTKA